MKTKAFLIGFFSFAALVSCTKDVIDGSGEITTQSRDVGPFNAIRSEGVFTVTITRGAAHSVEITADNNIVGKVRTQVAGNELRLYLDNDYNYGEVHLQANITVPGLSSLKNYGAGDVHIFDLAETGTFNLLNSGSGFVYAEGSARSLKIFNEGSGEIKAFGLQVIQCDATLIGSGGLEIECSELLKADIDGSCIIYYLGNPVIDATIKGSGQVLDAN